MISRFSLLSYSSAAILLHFLWMGQAMHGQDSPWHVGGSIGYGNQLLVEVDYDYQVWLIQGQLSHRLIQKSKWNLEAIANPQVNFSRFRENESITEFDNATEYGLNLGLVYRRWFRSLDLSYYVLLSAGPHYISSSLDRQADGFIFSDNLMLGVSQKILEDLFLDFRIGVRHLSNAGLKQPNGGINNAVFNLGLFKRL